jgi:hypothetical protein
MKRKKNPLVVDETSPTGRKKFPFLVPIVKSFQFVLLSRVGLYPFLVALAQRCSAHCSPNYPFRSSS